jgi:hypothetical protein
MPVLAGLSGIATATLSVSATDKAGNVGTLSNTQFRIGLVAPPVAVYEDTSFGVSNASADAHYTLAGQSYAALFQPYQPGGAIAPEGPRLVRYVLENPAAVPVGTTISLAQGDAAHSSGYAANENWTVYFPGAPYGFEAFSEQGGSSQCPGMRTDPGCGSDIFWANNPNGDYVCSQLPSNGATTVETAASASVTFAAYAVNNASETPAQSMSNGGVVVPAANGSTPGRLAVYLARPPNVTRSSSWNEALNWDSITARYENYEGFFLVGPGRSICYQDPDAGIYLVEDDYQKQDFSSYLASASTVIAGTLSASSIGLAPGTSNAVGSSRALVSGQSFTRTIKH